MIEAGFGMLQRTLAKESQKLAHLQFDLLTATVCICARRKMKVTVSLTRIVDANLFKEAFIKAQQENEALFSQDAQSGEAKEEASA